MTQSQKGKARVYIVDDEPTIRRGLTLLINRQAGLEVCGEAASGPAVVEQILSHGPTVAILDLMWQRTDCLRVARQLRRERPRLKILVFSMHDDIAVVQAAFRAGADGYVTKEEGSDKLIEAIHRLLQGEHYLGASLRARMPLNQVPWSTARPTQPRPCSPP